MTRVVWTSDARTRIDSDTRGLIDDVIERIADAHAALITLVPEIRIDCNFNENDAGWFRFRGDERVDIVLNVANCRTTTDVAYVLLHELRHAKQHAVIGWQPLLDADRQLFRHTHRAWLIEADATAWGVDETARLRLRRRRRLWPRMSRLWQPVSMHRLHCGDRPALRLWSEVGQ